MSRPAWQLVTGMTTGKGCQEMDTKDHTRDARVYAAGAVIFDEMSEFGPTKEDIDWLEQRGPIKIGGVTIWSTPTIKQEVKMTYTKQSQEEIEQDWYDASINAKLRKLESKMKYKLKSNKEETETTVLEQGGLYVALDNPYVGMVAVYIAESAKHGNIADKMQLMGHEKYRYHIVPEYWRKLRPNEEIERNPEGEGWRVKKVVETEPFKVGVMYERVMGSDTETVALYCRASLGGIFKLNEVGGVNLWEASNRKNWRKLQPGEVVEILEG